MALFDKAKIEPNCCDSCKYFAPRGVTPHSIKGVCTKDGMRVERGWFCGFYRKKRVKPEQEKTPAHG